MNLETDAAGKAKLTRSLQHPSCIILGIIGSIASLISIPLAFFFYFKSIESPLLYYYVHPVKAVILKSGQTSSLKTFYHDNEVRTDVTSVQVAIWNQGKKAIRSTSILKPLTLTTSDNTPILEATIRKTSRDVIGLSIGTQELQKGKLSINLEILEQNDGGIIQITYAGSPSVGVNVYGVIEGQDKIKKLEFEEEVMNQEEYYYSRISSKKTVGYVFVCFAFIFFSLIIYVSISERNRDGFLSGGWLFMVSPVICFVASVFMAIYSLLSAQKMGPILGF